MNRMLISSNDLTEIADIAACDVLATVEDQVRPRVLSSIETIGADEEKIMQLLTELMTGVAALGAKLGAMTALNLVVRRHSNRGGSFTEGGQRPAK